MKAKRPIEISKGIYLISEESSFEDLSCNAYLIVDGDEAVLIDPGNVLNFEHIFKSVCSIVPLEKIKYVILHHQDPDFCSSVPLFEGRGTNFTIVTHWRTKTLVRYYGVKSNYYIVNNNDFRLTLSSGRVLRFVPTPYLHFPGAIATYDQESKILFSSDLFAAFSSKDGPYADDKYIERMKAFHEHYMPSNEILRPVMEMLLGMEISLLAPQHGLLIKENIKDYIKVLRDLECGSILNTIKKDITVVGGYSYVCSQVLKRFASIFSNKEIIEAVSNLEITVDESLDIIDYNYQGNTLWNIIFESILNNKGLAWLIIIEPYVMKLTKEYDLLMPKVFDTNLKRSQEKIIVLNKENEKLKESNAVLEKGIKDAESRLLKNEVTGLYNHKLFRSFLANEIKVMHYDGAEPNPGLVLIRIDKLDKIGYYYGDKQVDEIFKVLAYILESNRESNELFFKLEGALFACFLPETDRKKISSYAERIRNSVVSSSKFIQKVTVSIGTVCFDELKEQNQYLVMPDDTMYRTALERVKKAEELGMNIVCSSSLIEKIQDHSSRILLVDSDLVNLNVLKTYLENDNYKVITARDGDEALKAATTYSIDIIISEIMIPKIDGFLLRERLLDNSTTKKVPFIIMSYLKDESSVRRAANLGIMNYFKKPYMLSELIGVVRNIYQGDLET